MPRAIPSVQCRSIERAHLLEWRLAIEHGYWLALQLRPQAQECLQRKFLYIDAGISFRHERPAQRVLPCHCAVGTLCGCFLSRPAVERRGNTFPGD